MKQKIQMILSNISLKNVLIGVFLCIFLLGIWHAIGYFMLLKKEKNTLQIQAAPQEEKIVIKFDADLHEHMQREKRITALDLISDGSVQKYVDPDVPFTQKDYIPEDMRNISREHVIDAKGDLQLRAEVAQQFEALAAQFYEDMGEKMVVVSSYRSYAYQAGIKARGCPDTLCAKAGHSEHQSGLALDFWSASSQAYWKSSPRLMKFYTWLSENAHVYGFHNSYQNGREIDGYEIEPWHWRYLGEELASYLKEKDMTFAQHYYLLQKK